MRVTREDYVSPEEARSILDYHSKNGVILSLDKIVDYLVKYTKIMRDNTRTFRLLVNDNDINITQRNKALNAMYNKFSYVPPELLPQSSQKKELDRVLNLMETTNCHKDYMECIKAYKEAKAAAYMVSTLQTYSKFPRLKQKSANDEHLVKGMLEHTILATSRYSTSGFNVQGLAKEIFDIISSRPGQVVRKFDSGQIEPRITYSHYVKDDVIKTLINLYNDAYFGLYHYAMLSEKDLDIARKDLSILKPHEITDELKEARKRLKVLLLSLDYGASESTCKTEEELNIYRRITMHPEVIKANNKIKDDVFKRGVGTFYSAFGTPVTPDSNTNYTNDGSAAWKNHVYRCGLNNPKQATASNLLAIGIKRCHELIEKFDRGNPLTYIGCTIHDATLLYVDESLADFLTPRFQKALTYEVELDGTEWIPIYAEREL